MEALYLVLALGVFVGNCVGVWAVACLIRNHRK
jgi:hypothetical protein